MYNVPEEKYDYGDIMTVEDWISACKFGAFIDYDGFCHPIKNGMIDDKLFISPSQRGTLPMDADHIIWFNR